MFFAATPGDDTPPKSVADDEALQAAGLTLDEVSRRPLRGADLRALLDSVARGCPVYPIQLLADELTV